ncbi:hypothetical protein SRABI128_06447 [Microbacterium sp. Bi128]|nr:hypothetical protein SRABI128_06447 [Microbacterium sp. Bi128]
MDGVEEIGAAGDGGERHAAGDALGHGDDVRDNTFVVHGEPFTGAAEAGLDLIGDEHDALVLGPVRQRGQEPVGGDNEAALALDRFDDDRGNLLAANLLLDHGDGALGSLGTGDLRVFLAERVAHRHAVDLGRERAEVGLVRHGLGGQRHGQVGAAVVGVVERDDGVPAGGQAGHLDGVFDRLGAGVEQHRALFVVARGEAVQLLGNGDIALVRRDHEAGVGEVLHGFLHGADDGGVRGADARHGDAGAEVNEGVAVDVVDDAAVGVGHEDRDAGRDASGDDRLAAFGQGDGLGAREVGLDAALLLEPVGDVMCGGGHGKAFLSVRLRRASYASG